MQQKILCEKVNQMDMVEYLEKLGFHPMKIIRNDYWLLSLLREEKTASFKVKRIKNLWYDFGLGGDHYAPANKLIDRFEKGMKLLEQYSDMPNQLTLNFIKFFLV